MSFTRRKFLTTAALTSTAAWQKLSHKLKALTAIVAATVEDLASSRKGLYKEGETTSRRGGGCVVS